MKEILVRMREILAQPENWIQGRFFSGDGKACCMVGALMRAEDQMHADSSETSHLAAYMHAARLLTRLARIHGIPGYRSENVSIECWQDQPERTHAEVLSLLDEAIAVAEARGD